MGFDNRVDLPLFLLSEGWVGFEGLSGILPGLSEKKVDQSSLYKTDHYDQAED